MMEVARRYIQENVDRTGNPKEKNLVLCHEQNDTYFENREDSD